MEKKKRNGLVGFMYAMAVIMLIVFAYMLVAGIIYIRTYMASYAMTISDAWQYMMQYLISGTLQYLVYGILFFAAGKITRLLADCCAMNPAQAGGCCGAGTGGTEIAATEADEQDYEAEEEKIIEVTESEDALEETKLIKPKRSRQRRRMKS